MDEKRTESAANALAGHSKDANEDKSAASRKAGEFNGDAERLKERAQHAAEAVGASVSDASHKIASEASELGGRAYRRASEAGDQMGAAIKEQPLGAVLAGALIGYFVGYLIHRSAR